MGTPDPADSSAAAPDEQRPARRRRIRRFLAAMVVTLLIGGIAIARWGSSDTPEVAAPVPGTAAPTTPQTGDAARGGAVGGAEHTRALLRGVQQDGFTLGAAPITIVEFVDFQCPFCRDHHLKQTPAAIEQIVKRGHARISMVPLAFLGPDSEKARHIFLKLSERNLGWAFADLLFRNQGPEGTGYMTPEYLRKLVAAIPGTTAADADPTPSPFSKRWADGADQLGKAGVIPGTPTFAVGYTGQDIGTYRVVGSDWSAALKLVVALERGGAPGTSPGGASPLPSTPPRGGGPATPPRGGGPGTPPRGGGPSAPPEGGPGTPPDQPIPPRRVTT